MTGTSMTALTLLEANPDPALDTFQNESKPRKYI
jgi:hypothetical protein